MHSRSHSHAKRTEHIRDETRPAWHGPIAVICRHVMLHSTSRTLAGQDGTPLFKTTSELVLLDVQVIQKKTATSTSTLRKEDLQVFEDGKPPKDHFLQSE